MALPSGAATRGAFHAKDLMGDANGVNGQGLGLPVPATSTAPASLAGADMVSLDVTTVYKKVKGKPVPKATQIVLTLAGPVQEGVNYGGTLVGSTPCDDTSNKKVQVGYQQLPALSVNLVICQQSASSASPTNEVIGYTEVDAAKGKITWVIDQMRQKPGLTFSAFHLTSSVFVLGIFDEFYPKGTFAFGV